MQQLPAHRLLNYASQRKAEIQSILLVIACAVTVRTIPLIWANPYPLGYDVVNYYIPVTAHFGQHWQTISTQFPLYAILLKGIYLIFGGDPAIVVSGIAVAVYCALAVALYSLARTVFRFRQLEAVFLAIFVILQLAVLRTTWDLHRDMLALTASFFAITLIHRSEHARSLRIAAIVLCIAAAASDRMVGAFFALTLLVWLAVRRERRLVLPAAAVTFTVISLSLSSVGTIYGSLEGELASAPGGSQSNAKGPYNFDNLKMTFLEIDGLLLLSGLYGLYRSRNTVLAVGTLVSMAGALSWIVAPTAVQLAADRWIILSGIFISIQAAYAVIDLSKRCRLKSLKAAIPAVSVGLSLVFAIGYSVLPYDHPLPTLASVRTQVESFVPTTMQFSTIDVQKTGVLLSEIDSINNSTETNAIIIGDKTLLGFMEMHLQGGRTFQYFNDADSMLKYLESRQDKPPIYLFNFSHDDFLVRLRGEPYLGSK